MADSGELSRVSNAAPLSGKRLKYVIGAAIIVLVIGYLIVSSASGSAAYYLTVAELQEQGPSSKGVRVAGEVRGDSIVWDPRALQLSFEMSDESGAVVVQYHGPQPDMLRDGATAVVEGHLNEDGLLVAESLLLKCPSKYEEAG